MNHLSKEICVGHLFILASDGITKIVLCFRTKIGKSVRTCTADDLASLIDKHTTTPNCLQGEFVNSYLFSDKL